VEDDTGRRRVLAREPPVGLDTCLERDRVAASVGMVAQGVAPEGFGNFR
jgi:hypothetical protein